MRWNDLFGSKACWFSSHNVFEVLDYSKPVQELWPVLPVARYFKWWGTPLSPFTCMVAPGAQDKRKM